MLPENLHKRATLRDFIKILFNWNIVLFYKTKSCGLKFPISGPEDPN
jgi:hypothetical protein